jgi:hypothetical protein
MPWHNPHLSRFVFSDMMSSLTLLITMGISVMEIEPESSLRKGGPSHVLSSYHLNNIIRWHLIQLRDHRYLTLVAYVQLVAIGQMPFVHVVDRHAYIPAGSVMPKHHH